MRTVTTPPFPRSMPYWVSGASMDVKRQWADHESCCAIQSYLGNQPAVCRAYTRISQLKSRTRAFLTQDAA